MNVKTRIFPITLSGRTALWISAAICLILPTMASPAEFHVNPVTGADDSSQPGSSAQPWRTINCAIGHTTAGDIITLAPGSTFTEKIYFGPSNGGTAGKPKVLRSLSSNRATIQPPTVNDDACLIHNCGHLRFENLRFVGQGMDVNEKDGINAYADSGQYDSLTFRNVEFSGFGKTGLIVGGWGGTGRGYRHMKIDSCISHDNRRGGITTYAQDASGNQDVTVRRCIAYNNLGDPNYTESHSGSGIILGGVLNGKIEYCLAYNNGQRCTTTGGPVGIWTYASTNVVIQFCEAYNNHAVNCDGGGFDLDGGCQNCVIQYCYSHDNDGPGYLICQYDGARAFNNNTVRYNISENDGRKNNFGALHFWSAGSSGGIQNTRIYGNTIYNSYSHAVNFQNTTGQFGTRLWNNIFMTANGKTVLSGGPAVPTALFQGNCYWSAGGTLALAGYSSLDAWRSASGQEKNGGQNCGINANPLLTSPGNGGTIGAGLLWSSLKAYELQTGSPCINTGLDLSAFGVNPGLRDFYGNSLPANGQLAIGAHQPQSSPRIAPLKTKRAKTSGLDKKPLFDPLGRRNPILVSRPIPLGVYFFPAQNSVLKKVNLGK